MAARIERDVTRGEPITIRVNGESVSAYAGETLATVLMLAGIDDFHRTNAKLPRAPFCNMGTCYGCQVRVRGPEPEAPARWIKACMAEVEAGLEVFTGLPLHGE